MEKIKQKLVVILGPTGSGKTDLAIALAKKCNGEVVNADSRAVYRDFTIGTAKPKGEQTIIDGHSAVLAEGVPHYLIDVCSAFDLMSLGRYKKMADEIIVWIGSRGKVPFLVGGTMQYISAVVENWQVPIVVPAAAYREKLEQKTLIELQEELRRIDPESYAVIDIKNPRRIIRALEVVRETGVSFIKQRIKNEPCYDVLVIGIDVPREELYRRLDARTDAMVGQGLEEEVRQLVKHFPWECPALSGIGYREWRPYFAGEADTTESTREAVVQKIKNNNHAYVRKQMTWFRKMPNVRWIAAAKNGAPPTAEKLLAEFLG